MTGTSGRATEQGSLSQGHGHAADVASTEQNNNIAVYKFSLFCNNDMRKPLYPTLDMDDTHNMFK